MPDEVSLSIAESARRLGVGLSTMKNLIGRGEIRSFHIGRRHMVLASSLREYASRLADTQAAS